jgi:COMPASS component SWD2
LQLIDGWGVQGPFATFNVEHHTALQWSGIKFSNDGKYILLPTTDSPIFLIDAFTGKKVTILIALRMYTTPCGAHASTTAH